MKMRGNNMGLMMREECESILEECKREIIIDIKKHQ